MKRLILVLTTALCLLAPASAFAYNPLDQACSTQGVQQSTACSVDGNNDPLSGPNGVLKKVTLLLSFIAGLVAVVIIIFAGFQYITGGDDPAKVKSARNMIIGAVVGLVIIAAAESIILFVVNKL